MRLPVRARSYAVLIGTSRYRSAELVDLPAVHANLADLADVLTDPTLGWLDRDRCAVVEDAADVRAVYRTLRTCADAAEDTLLVYFAGHGRVGPRNELFLSLTYTDPDELPVSALPYDLIREVLAASPAANRIVVLDCCFSGRAIVDMAGDLMGQLGVTGTYVLAATPPNAVALAPFGAPHTAFTGLLLALLRDGLPDATPLLSLAVIHRELLRTATERGLPRPQQRGTGTSQHLALARNATKVTATATRRPSLKAPRFRRTPGIPWAKWVTFAAVMVAVVLVVRSTMLDWFGPPPPPPPEPARIGEQLAGEFTSLAYAPDGRLAAVGAAYLRIWRSDEELTDDLTDPGHGILMAAAFSTDSRVLAFATLDIGVYLYDISAKAVVAGPFGGGQIRELAFNSDNTMLAMGDGANDVVIWNLPANRPLGVVTLPGSLGTYNRTGLAFHPTKPNILAVEKDESTQLWNARTRTGVGEPLVVPENIVRDAGGYQDFESNANVGFSSDGKLLLANGIVWALDRRGPVCEQNLTDGPVIGLSPDGRTAAVTTGTVVDGNTRLFDTATCSWVNQVPYTSMVAFSPDSRTLATLREDASVRWNVTR